MADVVAPRDLARRFACIAALGDHVAITPLHASAPIWNRNSLSVSAGKLPSHGFLLLSELG